MKAKIIIIMIALVAIAVILLIASKSSNETPIVVSKPVSKPEQFIVLLDLSDRIIKPGQIEYDKQLVIKSFDEFEKKVHQHLVINSKDRFQVCIAPQKDLPFDRDIESNNLTIDLTQVKIARRVEALKEYKQTLSSKLDKLYLKAFKGNDSKLYQGSNLWQFFNETLSSLTDENINTRLVVITDGYFDFEDDNPQLIKNNYSTTSSFMQHFRGKDNWKKEMINGNFGILRTNNSLKNLCVSVFEVRSKYECNLIESEMLIFIWEDWLKRCGIDLNNCIVCLHNNISNTESKMTRFYATKNQDFIYN